MRSDPISDILTEQEAQESVSPESRAMYGPPFSPRV